MNTNTIAMLKAAEKKVMQNTCIIDTHVQVNRNKLNKELDFLKEALGLDLKYLMDYVNPTTPQHKAKSAITAIRLNKTPNTIVLVTNTNISVKTWLDNYTARGITAFVYAYDTETFYEPEEYRNVIKEIEDLDFTMSTRAYGAQERLELEEMAETFGHAYGWTFSGPIKAYHITPDYIDRFLPRTTLPYAGFKGQYGFEHTVRVFNETLIEEEHIGGMITITPSKKNRLSVGQGCPIEELRTFKEFLMALAENDLLHEALEDGYAYCECGELVRTIGKYEEDGFCSVCDRPIPNYQAIIFEEYSDYNTGDDDDTEVESLDEDDEA